MTMLGRRQFRGTDHGYLVEGDMRQYTANLVQRDVHEVTSDIDFGTMQCRFNVCTLVLIVCGSDGCVCMPIGELVARGRAWTYMQKLRVFELRTKVILKCLIRVRAL